MEDMNIFAVGGGRRRGGGGRRFSLSSLPRPSMKDGDNRVGVGGGGVDRRCSAAKVKAQQSYRDGNGGEDSPSSG